ncbi:MAG: hypothetical protein VX741_06130, partial [Pseudomonadota bacterium]|nr:hypothetical protein [Pseudomonadota bacterium]
MKNALPAGGRFIVLVGSADQPGRLFGAARVAGIFGRTGVFCGAGILRGAGVTGRNLNQTGITGAGGGGGQRRGGRGQGNDAERCNGFLDHKDLPEFECAERIMTSSARVSIYFARFSLPIA